MIRNDNPDKGTETDMYNKIAATRNRLEMITPIRGRKHFSIILSKRIIISIRNDNPALYKFTDILD